MAFNWMREAIVFRLRNANGYLKGNVFNNLLKKSFYGKRKEKTINVLTAFFISYKSGVKTFLKLIINHCLKGTR